MAGTAIIIVNNNNEVLLGKRLKQKGFNKYAVPGGTIENGEEDIDACIRECEEETGLTIENLVKLPTTGKGEDMETRWFLTSNFYGNLENKEPEKCAGWEWFPLDNPPQPLWNGTGEIIKHLREVKTLCEQTT